MFSNQPFCKTSLERLLQIHFEPGIAADQLLPFTRALNVAENQYLWRNNEQQKYLYILDSGLLYACYETLEGRPFCKEVYWENDLIFGFRSLLTGIKFPYFVKAIEASRLVQIDKSAYLRLVSNNPQWQAFHLSVVSKSYMYKEKKEEFLLTRTPEQRVADFYHLYPELLVRVPQHIVASYLGITAISFSRIKKRLQIAF